jgi:WD40 repeat protein/serine/threonine protein kinase
VKPDQTKEETLFNAARALTDPKQRAAFLDAACQGAAELRQNIEALLAARAKADAYFDRGAQDPGLDLTRKDSGSSASTEPAQHEKPGDRIGRYKLREKIGEGGCGIVYVAEQEEPVRRRVALKVIKLGMDTRQVVARFEAERQALAMMDHPNIAKVLDAGATESGGPYFVMELVRGIRITDYCDQHKLSTRQRLDLFVLVCNAVQHAHQKGIIHRDLKPSNILVTLHDGVPVPKVIDFGIAKATEGRLTDLTVYTELHQFIGTPAYMSPEQAEMSGLDIDTRSDIYSLGVLLYELLTGRTPFDAKELLAAGLDEIRRTIREVEPPRPSTRLSTLAHGDLTTVAAAHGSEAPKLVSLIRGDLDWMVMKALEKDRTRRYETANGLAMDLQRHLNNEPVVARPPSALYRFQKLVRRNKLAFAAAGAIASVLVLGIVASTGQMVRATQAQRNEESQRQLAQAQTKLAEENRYKAVQNELEAERNLYAAHMNLAQQAWEENKIARLHQLLKETQDYADRGFEWYYWQRQTHLELRTLRGHLHRIFSAAFSPDSRRVVTGSEDHTAKVWDVATGRELFPLVGHKSWVGTTAFSADGRLILTDSVDQTAKLWDATTGRELHTFTGHLGPVSGAAFSPDGQRIVTGSWDHTAIVWEVATGRNLLTLDHDARISAVAFSPDGQRIVTGGGDPDFTAKIWDAMNGQRLLILPGHTNVVYSVAFSPSGQRIVTSSWDQSAIVWDAVSGQPLLTNKLHLHRIRSAAFSPDSQRIVTGSYDLSAKVWDADSGRARFTLKGHTEGIESVAYSPNGQWIATAGVDQTAKIWDASHDPEVLTLEGHTGPVRGVAFSPDCRRVVTASDDWTAKIWDAATGGELASLKGHTAGVRCAAFSPDGKRIVTGSADLTARVWDVATGRFLFLLPAHIARINSVAFSPDGQQIVTASADQTVKVWDAASALKLFAIPEQGAPIGAVGFSSNGKYLFTAGSDVRLWDSITGKLVRPFQRTAVSDPGIGIAVMRWEQNDRLGAGAAGFAAVSPDAKFLVGGNGPTADLWQLDSGRVVSRLEGHGSPIFCATFSPDGRRIVTGSGKRVAVNRSAETTAKLWDADTGRELLTFRGHTQAVYCVAFSPDGSRIVTGSGDTTAKIWQAATPEQVSTWQKEERTAKERLAAASRERERREDLQRAALAQDEGAIKQWLLLAPILPKNAETRTEAFEREITLREAQIKPRAGDKEIIDGRTFIWRAGRFEDCMINIDSWFGEMVPTSLAYAVCYVLAEADMSGLQIRMSGNQPKAYLNGTEVRVPFRWNFFVEDQNVVKDLGLNRGVNTVVLKFGGGVTSFRFTDGNGKPVKGIKVTLEP